MGISGLILGIETMRLEWMTYTPVIPKKFGDKTDNQ